MTWEGVTGDWFKINLAGTWRATVKDQWDEFSGTGKRWLMREKNIQMTKDKSLPHFKFRFLFLMN